MARKDHMLHESLHEKPGKTGSTGDAGPVLPIMLKMLVITIYALCVLWFFFDGREWQTVADMEWTTDATIAAMLALGNVTKLSGADATLGVALAKTGVLYPFFGTLLGWLGVALTGSDTASNVLFGSLQRITAEQLGLSPYLMCAANSTGGVMGKMIDAQSIVVAGISARAHGEEGKILRFVFWHSLALAALISAWVAAQAYWPPLQATVVR